jgi:hypothetical protein
MTHYYDAFWNPATMFCAIALASALAALAYAVYERAKTGAFSDKLWLGIILSFLFVCSLAVPYRMRDRPQITMTDDYVSCITWASTEGRRIKLPWSHVQEIKVASGNALSRRHSGDFLDFFLTADGRVLPWSNEWIVSSGRARCPVDWLEASPTEIHREAARLHGQCKSTSCRYETTGQVSSHTRQILRNE